MRQRAPIGFMSERTAEYSLVPVAIQALRSSGARVLPFYFWVTREGSRMGIQSGEGIYVRVAAVFARRPKIFKPWDDTIQVKFNDSLFRAANEGRRIDVPVLAGVPLVSSLFELTAGFRTLWFHLDPYAPIEDVVLEIALSAPTFDHTAASPLSLIAEQRLYEVIHLSGACRQWSQWVDCLMEFRSVIRWGWRFFSFTYSPFFLALVEDERWR